MRDPNFMMPKRCPAFDALPLVHAADDAPRQDADDLAADDGLAAVVDPDLVALVSARRLGAVRRQETARRSDSPASRRPLTGMRLTWTSIGERKMLICCHVPGRGGLRLRVRRDHHPTVGRRDDVIRCRPSSDGQDRGRSRRKTRRGRAAAGRPGGSRRPARAPARIAAPAMNGHPAGSIRICPYCNVAPKTRRALSNQGPSSLGDRVAHVHPRQPGRGQTVAAVRASRLIATHDVFHLVLQPKLLLLQLRFFELFGFGQEVPGGKFVKPRSRS